MDHTISCYIATLDIYNTIAKGKLFVYFVNIFLRDNLEDGIEWLHKLHTIESKNNKIQLWANKRSDNMFILVKMTSCYQKILTPSMLFTLRAILHSVTFFFLHNERSTFRKTWKINYEGKSHVKSVKNHPIEVLMYFSFDSIHSIIFTNMYLYIFEKSML